MSIFIFLLKYGIIFQGDLDGKWIRLNDAIEDVVDSYFAFLNEEKDKVLVIDLSKGIRSIEE